MKLAFNKLSVAGLAAALSLTALPASADILIWGAYNIHTELEDDSGSNEGDGFDIGISADVTDELYVFGEYDVADYDLDFGGDAEFTTISIGIGAKKQLGTKAQGYAAVSFENVELDSAGSEDESGFGVRLGVEAPVYGSFWLNGELYYLNVDETDGVFFKGRAGYSITPELGIYTEYRGGEYDDGGADLDRNDVLLGLYLNFE